MSPNIDSAEALGKREPTDNGSRVFSLSKHYKFTLGDQAHNYTGQSDSAGSTAPSIETDSGTSEGRGSNSASGSGSEDGLKSESLTEKDCEYPFEERLPTLDTSLHSVNLHLNQQRFQGRQSGFPTLPSLRDDPRMQKAFENGSEYRDRPHLPRMSLQKAPHAQPGLHTHQAQQQQQQPKHSYDHAKQVKSVSSGPQVPAGPEEPFSGNQTFSIHDEDITNKIASSSSDRPFGCSFEGCNWSFVRSSDQKRHLRSHKKATLQCPYWEVDPSCHRNGGAFNRLDVLKRHLKLMHYVTDRDGEVGNCKICNRYFKSLREFIDHTQACASHLAEHTEAKATTSQ